MIDAAPGLFTRARHARCGTLRSPAFTLLHVITHAYHHKGQIVAMCRLLGAPAPESDFQD